MDEIWDMHEKFIQNETTVYVLLGVKFIVEALPSC